MLTVLALGTLMNDPQPRTSAGGKDYATALMRVPSEGADAILVSLVAFNPDTVTALLAHSKSDALAVAGRAKLSSWNGRDGDEVHGMNVIADRILSAYMVDKKRQAANEARPEVAEAVGA